jgi:hypothetical protein
MRKYPYRELVGALTWIAVVSRPDIAFATVHLAQFSSNPGLKHWHEALHTLRYLKGTIDRVLVLGGDEQNASELVGYTDSDWGRDEDDRRSIAGYIFQLGDGVISWSSKKQSSVAHSSCDGEYMALSHGMKQALWLRWVMGSLGIRSDSPLPLFVDNEAAIAISKEARYHSRTKHIDIRYHAIREKIEDGTLVVHHVPSKLNLADIATKPLTWERHADLMKGLRVLG